MFKKSYGLFTVTYVAIWLPLITQTLSPVPPLWRPAVSTSFRSSDEENCKQTDTCTCVRINGTGINLHALDTGSKPRFTYSSTIAFLQWNPCTGFTAVGTEGVAVTFGYNKSKTSVYGMQRTATFGILDGFDYIGYKGTNRTTRIILECDEKSEPVIDAVQNFESQVLAVYKGPCNLKIPRGGSSSLSSGSILLITLFVLLVIYITVGCLVNIYVRKIDGVERIPNYQFWKMLPSLIKDGCLFTWKRRPGYQKM